MTKEKIILNKIKTMNLGEGIEEIHLKDYTTLHVGGIASMAFIPKDVSSLIYFLKFLREIDYPFYVLGKGSNVLASDEKIKKVIILLKKFDYEFLNEDTLTLGAGCLTARCANKYSKTGLSGLEFLAGIPGTIGGATAMNAGAWGRELKDVLESVTYIDSSLMLIKKNVKDLEFKYRDSYFLHHDAIIVSVEIKIKRIDKKITQEKYNTYLEEKKRSQPLDAFGSAGSTFKNPPNKLAWRLIDYAGCRNLNCNDAMVSSKHSNFLINKGTATSNDFLNLIEKIKQEVEEATDNRLELEWIILT